MPTKGCLTSGKLYVEVDGEMNELSVITESETGVDPVEVAEWYMHMDAMEMTVNIKTDRRALLYVIGAVTKGEFKFKKKWRRLHCIKRRGHL